MKAYIRNKRNDINDEIKQKAYRVKEIDELYFYRNMYNGMTKIYELYKDGYDTERVYNNVVSDVSLSDAVDEVIELTAIETSILSLLVGLNREALQEANSDTKDHSLFQYLNYQSEAMVDMGYGAVMSAYEYSKKLAEHFKFNPSKEGPFPYMLSVSKTDSRTRPYDYVTKIRNAFQHAEYFQKKGDIATVHIANHDDDGNLTFEGDLLLWPYHNFVEDFYGLGLGVTNIFELYDIPKQDVVVDREDLLNFINGIVCREIKFKKVPEKYKFSGQNALFDKLNKCFGLDAIQKHDVNDVLEQLKKEGLEFEITDKKIKPEYTGKIVEYLESVYSEDFMYNNEEFPKYASSIVKLIHYPNHDIANSLNNILRYIAMRKQYLILGEKPNLLFFKEQLFDEHLNLSFQYTLMLMKANVVSYAMECNKFERPDLTDLDVSKMKIDPQLEYDRRVIEEYINSGDFETAQSFVAINVIRNAIAHGNNRLIITAGKDKEIFLSDTFVKNHELYISGGLNDFGNILSNPCFEPDNIKVKKTDNKIKQKK
ncbi:MAG: hypothetical protein IJO43_02800 [Bacilli bacterium]|nr:hypothetical protein [Bacilli bacterium]